MRAMILAAGYGTRLKPLTFDCPKPLIRINDHYLIEYSLALLKRAGITEVIINTHHLSDQITKALGEGLAYGMQISYSHEEILLGTGGGIKAAEWFLNSDPLIVINSDIICDIDLRQVIQTHLKRKAHATMVVRKDTSAPNHDEIMMNPNEVIHAINQIPEGCFKNDHIGRMFTGIHIFSPIVFSYLSLQFSSIIDDFYQRGIRDHLTILGYDYEGFWMDLGTPQALKKAQNSSLPKIIF